MPQLIRLYIMQAAIGFGIAAAFVAMLLWFNVANLWHLVTHTEQGVLAIVILWISNGVVFAGVQFGISVMRMQDDDDDEPRGGHRQQVMHYDYIPIPVRADEDRNKAFWQKR